MLVIKKEWVVIKYGEIKKRAPLTLTEHREARLFHLIYSYGLPTL